MAATVGKGGSIGNNELCSTATIMQRDVNYFRSRSTRCHNNESNNLFFCRLLFQGLGARGANRGGCS